MDGSRGDVEDFEALLELSPDLLRVCLSLCRSGAQHACALRNSMGDIISMIQDVAGGSIAFLSVASTTRRSRDFREKAGCCWPVPTAGIACK